MTEIQKAAPSGLTVRLVSEMTGYAPTDIALVSKTVAVGASLQELAVFLHSCRALGLDPLLRQAYWIRRQGKGALQVGIDGFRAIAERSGTYAGAESIEHRGQIEWTYKKQKLIVPELARATIWKIVAGHKSAFVGEAYWNEFVPTGESEAFMWAKMPRLMLGKCAEAQALRRAFPAQLGALALADDMDAESQIQITEAEDPADKQRRNARRYDEIFTPDDERPAKAAPAPEADDEIPDEDEPDVDE
jgi:phage recombination protein Bet